ncbi:MSC_0882 family membrane protein [[Mycoplasma] testudinis]|uniref:MSC_0882 family membrane protein n=1 Tax=[Mycoplasma] testudinis TaxID=33924 RepID=UPI0004812608|nr:hypothetical protein [[Mycoplasma] testudinis]
MNYATNTIQLSFDELPYTRAKTAQIQLKRKNYLPAQLPTQQQIDEVQEWNQLQKQKRVQHLDQEQIKGDLGFPKFYEKELKYAFKGLLGALFILLLFVGGLVATVLSISAYHRSWHLLWLMIPLALVALYAVYHGINNYLSLRSESQQIEFGRYERVPSANVIKIYRRTRTGYLNLNWFGAGIYLVGFLIIISTLTTAWAYNLIQSATQINQFGAIQIYATNDWWPLYVIIGTGLVLGLYLLFHVYNLIKNHHRATAINNYYGKEVVSEADITTIKRGINKRDAIIFVAIVCLLSLIGVFVYKFVRRILAKKH